MMLDGFGVWTFDKLMSDDVLTMASIDVLKMAEQEMRKEFELAKAEHGWPADAKPIWRLQWRYEEPEQDNPFKDLFVAIPPGP